MWQLGFMFAIEDVPLEIGTVHAEKVNWSVNSNEKATSESIALKNCD